MTQQKRSNNKTEVVGIGLKWTKWTELDQSGNNRTNIDRIGPKWIK